MNSQHGRIAILLLLPVLLFPTLPASAACPVTRTGTVINGLQSECVIRPAHATSGEYVVMCRDAQQNGLVSVMRFNSGHTLLAGTQLNANVIYGNYNPTGPYAVDAVDVGGTGAVRWLTGWNGRAIYGNYRDYSWFRPWSATWQPQLPERTIVDPVAAYNQTRWAYALDVLPASRRVVQVDSWYDTFAPNPCHAASHYEWRAVLDLRDSQTLNMVPGAGKRPVSDSCSYTSLHAGIQGWGQEYPHVSASWFFADFFVVTWYDRANGCAILARIFDSNGAPASPEIVVDSAAFPSCLASPVLSPRVAATPGGFMVVWTRADNSLWMRTFDLTGAPFIAPRPVTGSTTVKGLNPDVDAAFVDPCGDGAEPYFAISWWSLQSGTWAPQFIIIQDLSDPVPLHSNWWYTGFNSPFQTGANQNTDRVSLSFFNNVNSNDSSCDDLTFGAAWTVVNPDSGTDEVRTQFVRYTPDCTASQTLFKADSFGASSQLAAGTSLEPACTPPDCIEWRPRDRPPMEPVLVFPPEGQW